MWVSTRGSASPISFSEAIIQSIPPEGGLYVPQAFSKISLESFSGLTQLNDIAVALLRPFFEKDLLSSQLPEICADAFNFPIPLNPLEPETEVLELFHGPTLAFKDVGARFLAGCVSRLPNTSGARRTVLVATSGDTGGAVAAAFHGQPGIDVAILYPKGRVSPEQEKQLTCWSGNVRAFSVRGDFDDCQKVVKEAFADPATKIRLSLISANSINVGRLLPQMVYYASSSLEFLRKYEVPAGYIIPSGNLGNAVAAFWARKAGFPIREIVLATNANRTLTDFFETGNYRPRATVTTLANAMDVGSPNNMERLQSLHPDFKELRRFASVISVDDAKIRETIAMGLARWKRDFCPHTATAVYAREKLKSDHWVIVSTAHAAKFTSVVGSKVKTPLALAALLSRESHLTEIDPTLQSLLHSLLDP